MRRQVMRTYREAVRGMEDWSAGTACRRAKESPHWVPDAYAVHSTMTFNEANSVEAFIRDFLCGGTTHHTAVGPGRARRSGNLSGLGWHDLAARDLPRSSLQVLVEPHLREALIRLNPEIGAKPDRTDEVLYRLRAVLMTVQTEGLVKAKRNPLGSARIRSKSREVASSRRHA